MIVRINDKLKSSPDFSQRPTKTINFSICLKIDQTANEMFQKTAKNICIIIRFIFAKPSIT